MIKEVVKENEGSLLDSYLGKDVMIFGACYHYAGKITKMDDTHILLEDAKHVLQSEVGVAEASEFKKYKDGLVLVSKGAIESIYLHDSF